MPDISQEDLDKLNEKAKNADVFQADKDKLTKELEDTRMEVLSPEYTEFLKSLENDGSKDKTKIKEEDKDKEDDLSKLTPKQILERAKAEVLDELRKEQTKEREEARTAEASRNEREIKKFAKEHDDFEQYRPVMYGLSKDAKNADLTLSQLYEAAKKHVVTIKTGTTEEQKDKSRRSSNEKPGGDTGSFEKLKKMTNAEINRAALDEVKAEFGPIPSA